MKHRELCRLKENDRITSVRVVPIPFRRGWCVDVLVKTLLNAGSRSETLESDRSTERQRRLRRFASIDSAARYLATLDINTFRVDLDDSLAAAAPDQPLSVSSAPEATAPPRLNDESKTETIGN